MAVNLHIDVLPQNGGTQGDDSYIYVNEGIPEGTRVGKITGWESLPNLQDLVFKFHKVGSDTFDAGGRYLIEKVVTGTTTEYYLTVAPGHGGWDWFDFEGDVPVHEEIWVDAFPNASATSTVGEGVFYVEMLDVEPETVVVPVVQFDAASLAVTHTEGDSGTVTYTYTVTRDSGVGASTVNWAVTGSGANAANAADFGGTLPGGTVSFANGETSKTFSFTVSGDTAFEADETFQVALSQATSGNATIGTNGTAAGTITNDDNRAPVITGLTNAEVNEDAGLSTEIGIFSANDPDDGQAGLVYELKDEDGNVANAGGLFSVNSVSGKLTVAKELPDVTGNQTFEIVLKVSDRNGGVGSLPTYQKFTITVKDVLAGNHAPHHVALEGGQTVIIAENTTDVGKLTAIDDDGDAISWLFDDTVAGNSNNLFEVVSNAATGEMRLKLKAGIDYEALGADKFVTVSMKATDTKEGGTSETKTFTINIKDVNEAPDTIRLNGATAVTVAENKPTGTEVGTLTAHDPEGKAVTYALSDSADGRFKLDATGTKILVADGARLDYEAAKFHDIKVVATDADGKSAEQVIRITLSDVNEAPPAPTNHAPSGLTLSGVKAAAEYAVAGTEVGSLAAADADSDALSYTLLDNAGGRFMLSGTKILVADGFKLDFEQATAHTVTVQVSDGHGGVAQQSFAIGVTDVAREITSGSPADDVFKAGKYNDKLFGGSGNDKLYGGAGNDYLKGHGGNDVLWGGAGKDILYAGAGKDVFVFDAKFNKKTNVDKILDFVVKDDSLWFDNALFKANKKLYAATKKGSEAKPLKMASKFFTVGDHAKDKDDFFVYDKKKGVLYYDADGSGAKAAVEVATLKKNLKMTYKDFFFI